MRKLRALIIDDERLAREEIRQHLIEYALIEIVGEAADADEAVQKIAALQPDILFLDVQMPGRSGLDLTEALEDPPEVIFTTAFDQYAVKAFELDALDYLVKPIRRERFQLAMEKVQARLNGNLTNAQRQHVFIREGERCYWVRVTDISLIESAGNYCFIYTTDRKYCLKRSLNQLEKVLDQHIFFRAGRGAIINTNFIKKITMLSKGKLEVSIFSGKSIEISGRQSSAFKNKNMI